MKISKKDLPGLEKQGVTVKRAMGKQPASARKSASKAADTPEKPAESKAKAPKKSAKPHASMGASMDHTAAQLEAQNQLIAQNTEVMRDFKDQLSELKPRDPVPYTFDIKRDGDGLLKRVHARPGIHGE